ncbi:YciK family oxidoreductase [Pseudocolwellia sp. AS88]|uniref:YciK family oxidoreductase n=1 Tax=Pseudocolwellia sp. AS88 TaxID=3063958 RepID=UPI0026ED6582|nr:YciK family oxidoreductase [Pseudocolwellia sp. AS88]MDO7085398.1 YciK family oxidoreductase [Pseudocolwellia sp. AS88]
MFDFKFDANALANKVILVTGAGDGIGKKAALTYASLGATVILLGKTTQKLEAVYDAIVEQGSPEPAIIPLDLKGATKQNYLDMVSTIKSQFGRLNGALLNAAMLGELSPFAQIHEQIWNDVMQVNVNSQYLLAQALLPLLQTTPDSSLVFTSSGVGNKGKAYWGAYSVSKFAIEGMMQVIADEYDTTSVRTNAINPGATNTKMRSVAYPGEDAKTVAYPADIMPAYVYLMCNDSVDVNGQVINAQ